MITFLLSLTGCNTPKLDDSTNESQTEAETIDIHLFRSQQMIKIQNEERPSWNIYVEFVELKKDGIILRICDNDNWGFIMNMHYYVLEYKDGEEWVKKSNIN